MSSSWPIVIGVAFIGAAAAWYDAKNEERSTLDVANVHDVSQASAQNDLARAEASRDRAINGPNSESRIDSRVVPAAQTR